jgi:tRNA threonylcarbamoyladenosine biosynthesis protein TsaB
VTVLAIESATAAAGVALADETGALGAVEVRAGRRHVELLHVALRSLLEMTGVEIGDVHAIAVDVGPGLFTGIRVGLAAAMGYAMALGVPVLGLSSLEILRRACPGAGHGGVIGVVDLRRGEVAWSLPALAGETGIDSHGSPAELVVVVSQYLDGLDELARRDGGASGGEGAVVLAGDGALRYRDLLSAGLAPRVRFAGSELAVPPVTSLALAAVSELGGPRYVAASDVRPIYLRDADVRIGWTTRHDAPGRSERTR